MRLLVSMKSLLPLDLPRKSSQILAAYSVRIVQVQSPSYLGARKLWQVICPSELCLNLSSCAQTRPLLNQNDTLTSLSFVEVSLYRTNTRKMFSKCSVSMSNSTLRHSGEAHPLSHSWLRMESGSQRGLKTSLRYLTLPKRRLRLRKGYSPGLLLSLLSAKVTSPTPSFSTNSHNDRSRDSPYLNSMTSSSEPSFLEDLSAMEMRGSTARMAIQFSELTRKRICLGSRKQTRKIEAFSLELNSTLSSVLKSPFRQRRPLICSSMSNLILIYYIRICTIYIYTSPAILRKGKKPLAANKLSLIDSQYILHTIRHIEHIHANNNKLRFPCCQQQNQKMIHENSASSNFQKKFSTQPYYDILSLNQQEHQNEQRRRKPLNRREIAAGKIEKTFQSAKKQTNNRIDDEIERFKFRLSFYGSEKPTESTRYEENAEEAPKSPREIKGVPIEKHLPRESFYQLKQKPVVDERQFNNFYITRHQLDNTPNLGNYSPRNSQIALSHITDLYYNSQKKYQELYFDNKTTSCIFNLKKQNDHKGRYFFVPKRGEDLPSTDMNPENVAKSFSVANPYKTDKILNFYKINGRELPSQYDQRHLSPNKNFYKDKNGKLVKEEMSFTARKYRDELLFRDLEDIKKSKKPYFQRDEICDERYFKQEKRNFEAKQQQA